MKTLPLLLLALAFPQDPDVEPLETVVGPADRPLPGLAWGVRPDAPIVLALTTRDRTPAAWGATRARLSNLGLGVLALAPTVGDTFTAIDVDAALASLHDAGTDTSRVALVAWGDAAPAALEHTLAQPGVVRSVTLLDPLLEGFDLARLADWPETSLQLVEASRWIPAAGVLAAALPDGPQEWYRPVDLNGRVDPDTDACATAIAQALEATLVTPDLVVPWFAADDERVDQPGFVRETLRLTRTVRAPGAHRDADAPHPRFVLMTYCVGDAFTVGMMTRQPFAGDVCFVAGSISGSFAWDTEAETVGAVDASGSLVTLEPTRAGFRDWYWTQLELPRAIVFQDGAAELMIGFHPSAGETVHLPGNELPFAARLSRR